ncbi:MAG: DUF4321 domain-containing protein [Schwartzia sp.]|nr:DUF4321 domain-containing protein [Schwartzia sp. (in: firmicutes)]
MARREVCFLRGSGFDRNIGLCLLFVVIGAILGGLLGEILNSVDAFSSFMPYLTRTYTVFDIHPVTIDLYVIRFTIGMAFTPNLMSFIGIVLALVLFRRY